LALPRERELDMLIVAENSAKEAVTMSEAILLMEQVFAELHRGEAEVLRVVTGLGPDGVSRFGIKSGVMRTRQLVGAKVGSYWPQNRSTNLPAHASTTFLLDPSTGLPKALVAASHLTCVRTAASDGVAIKHLSRPESRAVAMVGAGHQAWFELLAACEVRPIEAVRIWNRSPELAEALAIRVSRELELKAYSCPLQEAVSLADIVITITAASEALVRREWVRPGTHVSSMGSDAQGKFELDPELVGAGKLFADVPAQAITLGDFEAAYLAGKVMESSIRPIGAVVAGEPGRLSPDDITIYDSSGMALQDLAIAHLALSNAIELGQAFDFPFLAHETSVSV
jgi:alanine dehydrogenase